MAVIFGLAVWVFAGTGARDLGALGGALSGVPPYSVRNVKLATLLYLILAPVLIVGSWYINPAANQCLAA